ncbi:MAG: hypothetical protein Q4B60_06590 [Erysipelotrichaceae bacterium]|nr:hypothetical protein [Erysipelotrichaceae bacterium]
MNKEEIIKFIEEIKESIQLEIDENTMNKTIEHASNNDLSQKQIIDLLLHGHQK